MAILITIQGEVKTRGNVCRVIRRSNGDMLGYFSPNDMSVWQDCPYDPLPYRTVFKPDGATLCNWLKFKEQMHRLNGRKLSDLHMPAFIRDEANFLTVE